MTRAAIFPLCLLACVLAIDANLFPFGFPMRMMQVAKTARQAAPDLSARDTDDAAARVDEEIRNLVEKINGMKKRETEDNENEENLPSWLDGAFRKRDVDDSMNIFNWLDGTLHKRDTNPDDEQKMSDIANKIDQAVRKRDDEAAQNVGDILNKIDGVFKKRDLDDQQSVSDVLGRLNPVIGQLNIGAKNRRAVFGIGACGNRGAKCHAARTHCCTGFKCQYGTGTWRYFRSGTCVPKNP